MVEQDGSLVEVETDKASVTIPSPVAGTVVELAGAVGDTVYVGQVLARIDTGERAEAAEQRSPATDAAPAAEPLGLHFGAPEIDLERLRGFTAETVSGLSDGIRLLAGADADLVDVMLRSVGERLDALRFETRVVGLERSRAGAERCRSCLSIISVDKSKNGVPLTDATGRQLWIKVSSAGV